MAVGVGDGSGPGPIAVGTGVGDDDFGPVVWLLAVDQIDEMERVFWRAGHDRRCRSDAIVVDQIEERDSTVPTEIIGVWVGSGCCGPGQRNGSRRRRRRDRRPGPIVPVYGLTIRAYQTRRSSDLVLSSGLGPVFKPTSLRSTC